MLHVYMRGLVCKAPAVVVGCFPRRDFRGEFAPADRLSRNTCRCHEMKKISITDVATLDLSWKTLNTNFSKTKFTFLQHHIPVINPFCGVLISELQRQAGVVDSEQSQVRRVPLCFQ